MLKRRMHATARAVLVGAALVLSDPGSALADVVSDPPATGAKRRPRTPVASPPLEISEPDGGGPTSDGAVPASDTLAGTAPTAEPMPPAILEPVPLLNAVPDPLPETSPPDAGWATIPGPTPADRLPTTGGTAFAAIGGAFLSLGGLCVGAGRRRRSGG